MRWTPILAMFLALTIVSPSWELDDEDDRYLKAPEAEEPPSGGHEDYGAPWPWPADGDGLDNGRDDGHRHDRDDGRDDGHRHDRDDDKDDEVADDYSGHRRPGHKPPKPPRPSRPERAPEAYNAVTIQSRKTNRCIGNSDYDKWIDLRTRCSDWRVPQFEVTRFNQLRDIHTGKCLDTRDHLYSNRKAYPAMKNCRNNKTSQQFLLARVPNSRSDYYIMTRVRRQWLFAGSDRDKDLAFEQFTGGNGQRFKGYDNNLDALFY